MSAPASKKSQSHDDTHIGDHAASQPVSGVLSVESRTASNGFGQNGFIRYEKSSPTIKK